jgi:ATP-dependent Lon protease
MSSNADNTDCDNLDLPAVDQDVVSTGAAADSVEDDERLKSLPRILRYAILVSKSQDYVWQRLVAEIDELCPGLPLNAAWAKARDVGLGVALAVELDHRAVTQNEPNLRSLADCVRLLSLPVPRDTSHFEDHRRAAKSLQQALYKVRRNIDEEVLCNLEQFCFGWAALPTCTDLVSRHSTAAANATALGEHMAKYRIAAAKAAIWRQVEEEEVQARETLTKAKANDGGAEDSSAEVDAVPDHHLVVARLSDEEMKNVKLKDILGPLKRVINTALPLVEVPPLDQVRNALMFEFPYAIDVIDFALADLIGRTTIRLRPLLLVGEAGGGKSRFARRLGEVLGLGVWRTDASRSDGAVFGGTDRRWYSAEPCHPFLAIAQGKIANPLVLIDEIEKAATRSDYGRLWDCLLGFLEPETNSRYPDPALQTNLDLSHVSYIATANSLDPLPSPIRDRFRGVVTFPKPSAADLGALLPAVIADLAKERGLDGSWVPPLDGTEHTAVARHWRGGSVRRLRRIVEAILRERDTRAVRN